MTYKIPRLKIVGVSQKIKHFFGSALFLSNPNDWYVIAVRRM